MKIVVSGKGGSGKSTISAMLARALDENGYNVLLIDADESNLGLHKLMGMTPPVVLMDHLGGKKGFRQKSKSAFPGGAGELFSENMTLDGISDECISDAGGIKMLSIGKIHASGEGCACPMGALSKMILSKLVIGEKDIVLIDTAAGVEHFGRGLGNSCDMVLGIVDPTYESFKLAEKMAGIADSENIELSFILNKVDEKVRSVMKMNIDMEKVVAEVDNNEAVFMSGLEGRMPDVDMKMGRVVELVLSRKVLR